MDQTDMDIALLKRYLRARGFKLGRGMVLDKLMRALSEGTQEDRAMLGRVMRDPRQAAAMIGLALEDLSPGAPKRRKVKARRGIGSY